MPEFVRVKDSDFRQLDLHKLLIKNPESTFVLKASHDFSEHLVFKNDLLVVDKSYGYKKGDLVVAQNEGRFELIKMDKNTQAWGKVTCVIHQL